VSVTGGSVSVDPAGESGLGGFDCSCSSPSTAVNMLFAVAAMGL